MSDKRRVLVCWFALGMLIGAGVPSGAEDLRLVEAVKQGRVDLVRTLIKQKVDVNAPSRDGATPRTSKRGDSP